MTQSEYPNYERHIRHQRDDFNNLQLRFYLAGQLMRMNYGQTRHIPASDAFKAWPPTGEHDRSAEGSLRALALAMGGGRPETSYTTQERIINDLDGSFSVTQNIENGDWIIHRLARSCPSCRGSKLRPDFPKMPAYAALSEVGEMEEIAVRMVPCDCKPSR